jgi:hypothetical protein
MEEVVAGFWTPCVWTRVDLPKKMLLLLVQDLGVGVKKKASICAKVHI